MSSTAGRPQDDPGRFGRRTSGREFVQQLRERVRQLPQPFPSRGAGFEDRPAELFQLRSRQLGHRAAVRHVHLVQHDEPWPVVEAAVGRQLRLERRDVGGRIAVGFERGRVHHVYEHRAALDVPEEFQPESLTGGRTRDQARHVGDHERAAVGLHDAEIGHEGRERIVSDLRTSGRHGGDQRRLAGRWEADEADVRDALEFEHDVERFTRLAQLGEAGRSTARVRQRRVAATAPTAPGRLERRTGADQIGQHLAVPVQHDGAVRDLDDQVCAVRALPVAAGTAGAVGRAQTRTEMKIKQRVYGRVDDEQHVSAVTAAAAVGTTEWLELLPQDRDTAVPAVAGLDMQDDAVNKGSHSQLQLSVLHSVSGGHRRGHVGGPTGARAPGAGAWCGAPAGTWCGAPEDQAARRPGYSCMILGESFGLTETGGPGSPNSLSARPGRGGGELFGLAWRSRPGERTKRPAGPWSGGPLRKSGRTPRRLGAARKLGLRAGRNDADGLAAALRAE